MSFSTFAVDLADRTPRQGDDYFRPHKATPLGPLRGGGRSIPQSGATLVSVGAGSAYVEAALVASCSAVGVVVDLPEVVTEMRAYYEDCKLMAHGAELSQSTPLALPGVPPADLVISAEIVEHLPSPPSQHFSTLRPLLSSTGTLLVATPNAGSLRNALKTLLQRPLLPPAERTFGPVSVENEGVHRREYVAEEITAALRTAGYIPASTKYVSYRVNKFRSALFLPLEGPIPYFREGLVLTATLSPSRHGAASTPASATFNGCRARRRPPRSTAPRRPS